jgi:23S rRNA (cytidine1920-2'-O)/16S rRNA (cytidine1409-2'-O)-methyltransferase
VVKPFLKPNGKIVALLKPHYQADKSKLVKGVLEEQEALRVKDEVEKNILNSDFIIHNSCDSPILGGGGNIEYLLLLS